MKQQLSAAYADTKRTGVKEEDRERVCGRERDVLSRL